MFLYPSNNQLENEIPKRSNKIHAKCLQKKIIELLYMKNQNKLKERPQHHRKTKYFKDSV